MTSKELETTLRLITKVSSQDSRLDTGQKDRLQKAKRELEKVRRSGKWDGPSVIRAVSIVAAVLLELVEDDASDGQG